MIDRAAKAMRRNAAAHVYGESDGRVVPKKPPNNDGPPTSAEVVEGRERAEGNP